MDNTKWTFSSFSLKGEGLQGKGCTWEGGLVKEYDQSTRCKIPKLSTKKRKKRLEKKRLVIVVTSKLFDERNYSFYNNLRRASTLSSKNFCQKREKKWLVKSL